MGDVVVTGARGFVGAHVVADFVRRGYRVHAVSRSAGMPKRIAALCPDVAMVTLHQCDLADEGAVMQLMQKTQPVFIVHCATYGGYPKEKDADLAVMTNVVGTLHLLRAARACGGLKKFINIGSSSEYGMQDHPMNEQDVPNPIGPYAVTKLAQTYLVSAIARKEQLPVVTLRLFSVFGSLEESGRLFADITKAFLQKETLTLGDAMAQRDFVYIADVMSAIARACDTEGNIGEIYNVGTGVSTTIGEVVDVVARVAGHAIPLVWGSAQQKRAHTSPLWVADMHLTHERLGWRAMHTVEDGVRDMLLWYGGHPDTL